MKEFHQCLVSPLRELCFADISLSADVLDQENFREMTHITSSTDAMKRKDLEEMLTHVADDVVLNTPLASEPVKGKATIRQVVGALLKVVDKFDFLEFMQGLSTRPRFSKSLPAQSNWTEWTIGVSIRRV